MTRRLGRPRRLALAGASALALFFIVYAIGMNVFLSTRLFRDTINFDPTHFRIEYTNARSIFPSLIHVEGLEIRGRDGAVEWILRIDRCDFQVSLFELAMRKFHASHVRGDGLAFRLRLRVVEVNAEHVAALPRVPGFEDPPMKDAVTEKPPPTDAEYRLWGVQLDDVDADHIRELWVDTMRYSGQLRVRGRWLFHPLRWLDVGPALVELTHADIGYGLRTIVRDVVGTVRATVHPFDVRGPQGLSIVDQVSLDARLQGTLLGAEGLDVLMHGSPAVFRQAEGPLDVALIVDHGVLRPGTHLRTESLRSAVAVHDVECEGKTAVVADVSDDDQGSPVGTATARTDGLTLHGKGGGHANVAEVRVGLTSRKLDLAKLFPDAEYEVDVRGAETAGVGAWVPVSTGVRVDGGSATGDARIQGSVHEQTARGELGFAVRDLAVVREKNAFGGGAVVKIRVSDASLPKKTFVLGESEISLIEPYARAPGLDLRAHAVGVGAHLSFEGREATARAGVRVQADGLRLRTEKLDVEGQAEAQVRVDGFFKTSSFAFGPSEVVVRDAALRLSGHPGPPAAAVSRVRIGTERFEVDRSGPAGSLSFELTSAEIGDLGAVQRVATFPPDFAIDRGRASMTLLGEVAIPSWTASVRGGVTVADAVVRVGERRLGGTLTVKIRGQPRGGVTDMAGTSVAFDGPAESGEGGKRDLDSWWLRGDLTRSELRASGDAGLRARVHLAAKDMTPVTALLASRTPVPAIILNAFPLSRFESTCDLHIGAATLEIQSLAARGDGLTAELEYAKWPKGQELDLLLETSLLDAGIRSADDGTEFTVADARTWYEQKVVALRGRESKAR